VPTAKKLIDQRFPGRHTLMLGDSRETVPKFTASNPELRVDLVFIDGGHAYEIARADLLNMRELSTENTAVIMDDLVPQFSFGVAPTKAWSDAIVDGLARQQERLKDGRMRGWALGQYVF
jgi:Methyltransferase domain